MNKYKVLFEHLPPTIICASLLIYFDNFNLVFIGLCIFFGWMIDIDHMFDYLLFKKSVKLNLQEFMSGNYFKICNKIYLPLHSYELSIVLIFIFYILNDTSFIFVFIAHFLHLLQDQFTNKVRPLSYFFTYRAVNSFNASCVCK